MTNTEMALRIGEEINRLRSRIDALEGVMLEYRVMDSGQPPKEIPWRQDLKRRWKRRNPIRKSFAHDPSDCRLQFTTEFPNPL